LGGLILIIIGLILLFHNLDVAVFHFLWPLAIVAVGVYIIWRASVKRQDAGATIHETGFIGDYNLGKMTGELDQTSISHFIGDVKLDLTGATLKPGTTTLRLFTFIGNVRVVLPERMPVEIDGTSFVSDMEMLDRKKSGVFPTLKAKTADYDTAPNRLHIACTNLVGDITVGHR
jgi:predicted membrane protein